ncbi:hypothetical protein LTR40_006274 [Exophiala xenobiotica]|nr:hypothetical protein LTR40_006274 [Exophiala xenobiotica]
MVMESMAMENHQELFDEHHQDDNFKLQSSRDDITTHIHYRLRHALGLAGWVDSQDFHYPSIQRRQHQQQRNYNQSSLKQLDLDSNIVSIAEHWPKYDGVVDRYHQQLFGLCHTANQHLNFDIAANYV